jgi:eukaryotic-like serine/threonine-protein kinase
MDQVDSAPGSTAVRNLGHYLLLDKVGEGGMGVVYRARDQHLDRDVAIKILPDGSLTEESARRRFRKEAFALSKLNHPHIATIHDFDTEGNTDFLVQEFIEGLTLSEILKAGPLLEKEILIYGSQLAEGIAAAHDRGIIHSDLKPSNIRVTPEGHLKILDFGLARSLRGSGSGESEFSTVTESQTVSGTLPYLSPEQIRNEKSDHRVDLWAMGCVLYEMATARRAFTGSGATLIHNILNRQPILPTELNSNVSCGLEAIILKCLEKDASLRYGSAREIDIDLRRLSAPSSSLASIPKRRDRWLSGIIVAVIVLIAGFFYVPRLTNSSQPARIESIAVLPLTNLSGDKEQDYFADGITQELITDLGRIKALRVISQTSAMRYKGSTKSMPEIGRELGVSAVLEGSVQRSGSRVRISAQLIDTKTDRNIWGQNYERELTDVLALRDELARAIATEIRIEVTPNEKDRLSHANRVVPEAYEVYLKGRRFADKSTPEGLTKAIEFFEQAVALDPNYALAWAALGHAHFLKSFITELPLDDRCIPAMRKAMELDPGLAEAHVDSADLIFHRDWKWQEGLEEFRRAVELDPGSVDARQHFAIAFWQLGRFDDALRELRSAHELDPLSPGINLSLASMLRDAGRLDEAETQFKKTLELESPYPAASIGLAMLYDDTGRANLAIIHYRNAASADVDHPARIKALNNALNTNGSRGYWKKSLEFYYNDPKKPYVGPLTLASMSIRAGENDRAIQYLQNAFAQHSPRLSWIYCQSLWNPIRRDPRFQALIDQMNFPANSQTVAKSYDPFPETSQAQQGR